jgi:hypothetical protein
VLRNAARKYRSGKQGEDGVYVWWGKLRSEGRNKLLPPLEEILALEVERYRDDPGEKTNVYLTAFASLYVAHLPYDQPKRGAAVPWRAQIIREINKRSL